MSLTRNQILGAEDLKTEKIKVPEWGGEVHVATMTGEARDAWEQALVDGKGGAKTDNISARLLAYCLVNDKGKRLFSESDVTALGRKSSAAIARLAQVAMRLNGLSERDIEDAAKN